MPIEQLSIRNFKGVAKQVAFEIKPVTLFIGPNSSGKSSCIHAMAALAQTTKLPSARVPIVLDDEFAQVHLGRFIEVIHSKSYSDSIDIGLGFRTRRKIPFGDKVVLERGAQIAAIISFKSTKRTQDIYIEKAEFNAEGHILTVSRGATADPESYRVTFDGKVMPFKAVHIGGLKFGIAYGDVSKKGIDDYFGVAFSIDALSSLLGEELRQTLYLGPFRQSPLRRYPTRGSAPVEVGAQGESAVTLLANEYVQTKTRVHTKQIGAWMQVLGLAKGVDVSRVGKSDLFDVAVTLTDDAKLPIADLGYGVSQVLPVLAQCTFAPKGSTLLFEQPELHLHPAAARGLASIFAEVAVSKGVRIVAETHSQELFIQLLDEVRAGNLSLGDIAAYKVVRKNGSSHFEAIEIVEEDGYVEVTSPWDTALLRR